MMGVRLVILLVASVLTASPALAVRSGESLRANSMRMAYLWRILGRTARDARSKRKLFDTVITWLRSGSLPAGDEGYEVNTAGSFYVFADRVRGDRDLWLLC